MERTNVKISLQLQGDTCHIARSREELEVCDRVKVSTPHSYLVLDEINSRTGGTVRLGRGHTMHIDAYGTKGEGQLLSCDYRRLETGLVLVKTHWNDGIQIVIEQEQEQAS
jgi:hypothetical protein